MRRSNFREPKRVLIFDSRRKLIGVVKSLGAASEVTKITAQSISLVCTGKRIVSHNHYFRHQHPDVAIDLDEDIDILDLIEYDKMCKEDRRYYPKNFDKAGKPRFRTTYTAEQIEKLKK